MRTDPDKDELQSLEVICAIGDAAVNMLESVCNDPSDDPYCELDEDGEKLKDIEAGVKFILDNPAAPLAAQHDAWIARNKARLAADDPRLVPYDKLPFGMQLKARLWRHIVHAIIG